MEKQFSLKRATIGILTVIMITSISIQAFSYPGGVAGRTLKPGSTNGCTCHQSALNTAVLVSVTGPTTLVAGATGIYTFSVSRSSGTFSTGGIDIAVSSGTLGIGTSTGIKMLTSEVVQSAKFTGATTKTFTLTAPATAGPITIYCTGAGGTNPPNWNNGANFTVNVTTGISQIEEVATTYSLAQNFPNPFNPTTNISFSIPKSNFVTVSVYDITGKLVQQLVNSNLNAGKYNATWDASNFASGVYFYKIQAGDFVEMKKMSLIK
jgi:hypothetical protein